MNYFYLDGFGTFSFSQSEIKQHDSYEDSLKLFSSDSESFQIEKEQSSLVCMQNRETDTSSLDEIGSSISENDLYVIFHLVKLLNYFRLLDILFRRKSQLVAKSSKKNFPSRE